MPIDSHNIDSEITLELDEEDITVAEFSAALSNFLGLVKEVSKTLVPSSRQPWLIKLYPGSAGVGLYHKPGEMTANELGMIRQTVMTGLQGMERGERPKYFNDRAIKHASDLSKTFAKRKKPSKIKIWNLNKTSISIKPEITTTASKILDAVYEDEGSIDGTLEIVSGHGGAEVTLYDPIDGRAIKCEVDQDGLEIALANFMKRVEIYGKIRYRKDGVPVSVKAEQIIPFPAADKLPTLESIRGIFKD